MSHFEESFDLHSTTEVTREGDRFVLEMRQPGSFAQVAFEDGICGPTNAERMTQDLARLLITEDHGDDLIADVVKLAVYAGKRSLVESTIHNTLGKLNGVSAS